MLLSLNAFTITTINTTLPMEEVRFTNKRKPADAGNSSNTRTAGGTQQARQHLWKRVQSTFRAESEKEGKKRVSASSISE